MIKTIFVRIDFDPATITSENIQDNLIETIEQCPIKIKTKFYQEIGSEHCHYIEKYLDGFLKCEDDED